MTLIRRPRPRVLAAVLVAAAVPVLAAGGAAAAEHEGSAPAERIDVRQGPGAFWTADTPHMVPGTTELRYLDVVSTFPRAVTLTSRLSGEGELAGAGGLRTAVEVCGVSWAADGSCAGNYRTLLPDTPLANPGSLPVESLAAHGTQHLKVRIAVPKDLPQRLYGSSGRVVFGATASDTGSGNSGGGDHGGGTQGGGSQGGTGNGGGGQGGAAQGGSTQGGGSAHGGTGQVPHTQGMLSHTGTTLLPMALLSAGALIAGLAAIVARRHAARN
ncbi:MULTISPECIES: hypothetical protein [unclassified Streptomyces]|uniref:hypothetical protein n=1 Tax=unclassified Streptomyces TaxID=2593676 RepID=UPI003804B367